MLRLLLFFILAGCSSASQSSVVVNDIISPDLKSEIKTYIEEQGHVFAESDYEGFMKHLNRILDQKGITDIASISDAQVKDIIAALPVMTKAQGERLTEEELLNLVRRFTGDPQAARALKKVSESVNKKNITVKYCPVDGERFSAKVERCPVHGEKLGIIE